MKTLIISDLERSHQLDRPTMSAVRGGWKLAPRPHAPRDASIDAKQDVPRVHVDNDVTQDGHDRIGKR